MFIKALTPKIEKSYLEPLWGASTSFWVVRPSVKSLLKHCSKESATCDQRLAVAERCFEQYYQDPEKDYKWRSCSLIRDSVCVSNTKRFSHLYIALKLLFFIFSLLFCCSLQPWGWSKTVFELAVSKIGTSDRRRLNYLSWNKAFLVFPCFWSFTLAPILSCICTSWRTFDGGRCGARSQHDTLS